VWLVTAVTRTKITLAYLAVRKTRLLGGSGSSLWLSTGAMSGSGRTTSLRSGPCFDFDESCFEPDVAIKQSLGFSPPFRSKLLPDAVPTISGKRKRVDDIASSSLAAVQKLTRKGVSTVLYSFFVLIHLPFLPLVPLCTLAVCFSVLFPLVFGYVLFLLFSSFVFISFLFPYYYLP